MYSDNDLYDLSHAQLFIITMLKKAHSIHVTSEVTTQLVTSETDSETLKQYRQITKNSVPPRPSRSASGAKFMEGNSVITCLGKATEVQIFSSRIRIIEQF